MHNRTFSVDVAGLLVAEGRLIYRKQRKLLVSSSNDGSCTHFLWCGLRVPLKCMEISSVYLVAVLGETFAVNPQYDR